MRILGFDTATRATTVALCEVPSGPAAGGTAERGRLDLERRDDPPPGRRPGHATHLMALIVELLDEAGVGWEDIDRLAVGTGPGTFTGLRIGVATARALARARAIPLVGVSTLAALAAEGQRSLLEFTGAETVLAVIDARRREVFAAAWPAAGPEPTRGSSPSDAVMTPRVLTPDQLAVAVRGSNALAIGDGAVEFRSILESSGALVPDDDSALHQVTARSHCRLAGELNPSADGDIRPEYLRLPDAEIARRAAGRK